MSLNQQQSENFSNIQNMYIKNTRYSNTLDKNAEKCRKLKKKMKKPSNNA